jgi:hypothetical protein
MLILSENFPDEEGAGLSPKARRSSPTTDEVASGAAAADDILATLVALEGNVGMVVRGGETRVAVSGGIECFVVGFLLVGGSLTSSSSLSFLGVFRDVVTILLYGIRSSVLLFRKLCEVDTVYVCADVF